MRSQDPQMALLKVREDFPPFASSGTRRWCSKRSNTNRLNIFYSTSFPRSGRDTSFVLGSSGEATTHYAANTVLWCIVDTLTNVSLARCTSLPIVRAFEQAAGFDLT